MTTADDVYARAGRRHSEDRLGAYELALTSEAMQSMDGRKQAGAFYPRQRSRRRLELEPST